MKPITVGFAGMTHLGINSAAATAARGFNVLGYDADTALIARMQSHEMPVTEPDLDDYIAKNAERLSFSAKAEDLNKCDIVYISADVPTDDEAKSDLTPINALIETVARNLNGTAIMVVLCQVPPGFCRTIQSVPHDRLVYQVETLIFGRAVERAMFPERFIIGLADPSKPLPAAYEVLLKSFECPLLPMRYESAELAKISINFCLVSSVSVANTLAEVSEAVGADWSEIVPALKLDKRIGQYSYLAPGLGISGGNLERDLRSIINIGSDKGTDIRIVEAWVANSKHRKDWIWRVLRDTVLETAPNAKIAVLGLAYKENTHSTKNSPSLQLLSHLTTANVKVHDPIVDPAIVPFASGSKTPLDCAQDADVLIIATPWPEYKSIEVDDLKRVMAGKVIIDPYRILNGDKAAAAGFIWHTLGVQAKGA